MDYDKAMLDVGQIYHDALATGTLHERRRLQNLFAIYAEWLYEANDLLERENDV